MAYTPFLMFTQRGLILPVNCFLVLIGCLRRTRSEVAPRSGLVASEAKAEARQHGDCVARITDCEFQHGIHSFPEYVETAPGSDLMTTLVDT